ncbi:histidine kinase, partial [Enterobacter hormaechei]|uniref:histidine kinase n=1 Tax=Enterobacter hormaechei TaxID=158836 RepID=UPI00203D80B5
QEAALVGRVEAAPQCLPVRTDAVHHPLPRQTIGLRLARELHDVAGHKLTAMRLNLRALAADPVLARREGLVLAEQLSGELL